MKKSRILSAIAGCMLMTGLTTTADAQTRVSKIQFNDDVSTFTYNASGTLTGAVRKEGQSTYKYNYSVSGTKVVQTTEFFMGSYGGDKTTRTYTLFPGQQKMTQVESDGKTYVMDKSGYYLDGKVRENYTWKGDNLTKVSQYGANGWWQETRFKYNGWGYKPCTYTVNWIDFILAYYDLGEFDWEWWQCAFWPFSEFPTKIEVTKSSKKNFTLVLDYYPMSVGGKSGFKVEIKTDVDGKMTSRDTALVYFD